MSEIRCDWCDCPRDSHATTEGAVAQAKREEAEEIAQWLTGRCTGKKYEPDIVCANCTNIAAAIRERHSAKTPSETSP